MPQDKARTSRRRSKVSGFARKLNPFRCSHTLRLWSGASRLILSVWCTVCCTVVCVCVCGGVCGPGRACCC